MGATCMVCGQTISEGDNCGAHPQLLLAALWGEAGGGQRERLQVAYMMAQAGAVNDAGHWDAGRFKGTAVRELLPWRASERGELAEVLRGELTSGRVWMEAEIAAALGLSELRGEMGGFAQEEDLCATAQRRDLEIKAAGGREPAEVGFLEAYEEFNRSLEANMDGAQIAAQMQVRVGSERAAVALMLHCEIIDSTGEFFEGIRAVRAAQVAAILGLGELDEVVYLFSDDYYKRSLVVLDAAGALARTAGGARAGEMDGGEA